jgi:hypothetical protein
MAHEHREQKTPRAMLESVSNGNHTCVEAAALRTCWTTKQK